MPYQTIILNNRLTIAGFYEAVDNLTDAQDYAAVKTISTYAVIFHNTLPVSVSMPGTFALVPFNEQTLNIPPFVALSPLFSTVTGDSGGTPPMPVSTFAILLEIEAPSENNYNEIVGYAEGGQGEGTTGTFDSSLGGYKQLVLTNDGSNAVRYIVIIFKLNGTDVVIKYLNGVIAHQGITTLFTFVGDTATISYVITKDGYIPQV